MLSPFSLVNNGFDRIKVDNLIFLDVCHMTALSWD